MKIIGVNGIHTHGASSTDIFLKELEFLGYEVEDIRLPKVSVIRAWWHGKDDAKECIIPESKDGDILLAHSFGCLRAAYAMKKVNYQAVFLFRPAMSTKWKFDYCPNTHIYCSYSDDDNAILVGGFIPLHPFGHAGRKGFKSKRVRNIASVGDHSEDFTHPILKEFWLQKIVEEINAGANK